MEAFSYPKSGVIIADAKVNDVYRHYFELKDPLPSLFLKAGERFKSLNSLRKIYDFLTAHNVHRSETIHVFGGGMICDLAAYAVATFKRGCRLKLYPTTLLAMVDAAIGGKCAINYQQLKNHIGAFYPAEEIIIHPTFLDSLKATEIRQGMAEMLKCYLICDRLSELELLSGRIPETKQILEYANFKMSICAKDPFD
jgi:3-dehydroquinate synthase